MYLLYWFFILIYTKFINFMNLCADYYYYHFNVSYQLYMDHQSYLITAILVCNWRQISIFNVIFKMDNKNKVFWIFWILT